MVVELPRRVPQGLVIAHHVGVPVEELLPLYVHGPALDVDGQAAFHTRLAGGAPVTRNASV